MSYRSRSELYAKFSKIRKRPLIVYVTSSRPGPGASGDMNMQVIPELLRHLDCIPSSEQSVDVFLVSHGGDAMVSYRMMWLLRERFPKSVSVILPYEAYSAATLLACGANEILMHPYANLGPVDPQIIIKKRDSQGQPETKHFAVEDLKHFFNFLRDDLKITDQGQIGKGVEFLCNELSPIQVGFSKRASELARSVAEKMLESHLADKETARKIAKSLTDSYYDHGYPLGRKEAKELGLPVVSPPKEVETLMWSIWKDFEDEMQCNTPFDPLEVVLSSSRAANVGSVTILDIPANVDSATKQAMAKQALEKMNVVKSLPAISFSLLTNALESACGTSQVKQKGKISAIIQQGNQFGINVMQSTKGWQFQAKAGKA
jgi:hypothetical protein